MIGNEQQRLGMQDTHSLDSVEEYRFKHPPIRGFPELRWNGKRPFTSTQYYPAQHKETHGPEVNGWRNKLYWGDNLQVMSHLLKDYRGQVKLVYIDPPFDSKADYKKKIQLRGQTATNDHSAFEEKQYTDIWTNDEYLQFMFERLILIRELLCPDGLVALQCDWRKVHQLRCILDEVFGYQNFRGEALVRAGTKNVQSQFETVSMLSIGHNSILLYSKSTDTRLPKLLDELDDIEPGKWDTFWRGTDRPTMRYDLFGQLPTSGQWRWKKERAKQAAENYEHYLINYSQSITLDKYYLKVLEEDEVDLDFVRLNDDNTVQYYVPPRNYKVLSNVWFDLSYRGTQTAYPTEKHEDIVARLVNWLTVPSDLVFDCFMGSGTAQAVSMKSGRRFIGADINLGSVQITTKRLLSVTRELRSQKTEAKQPALLNTQDGSEAAEPTTYYVGFEVYNVNHYDIFRNPAQARDLLLEALEVNRLEQGNVFDGEKDGRMVKLMPVNRIATRADLNDLLANLDYRVFEKRKAEQPNRPVERIKLVCMGHEPDLGAILVNEVKQNGFTVDVDVVDILRDKQELQFKRDAEAKVVVRDGQLVIEAFYPMNLLSKLSLQAENVEEWRELVESVMVDWNYDGAVLEPALVDVPEKDEFVQGAYTIPEDAGTIRVKITDLLSESLEVEVAYG